jgi:hypothetical protein
VLAGIQPTAAQDLLTQPTCLTGISNGADGSSRPPLPFWGFGEDRLAAFCDAEHPFRNWKVLGSNSSSGSNRRSKSFSGIADGAAAAGGHSFGWIMAPQARPPRFAS